MRDNTADYRDIFLNDLPMMDMRAPVEFTKGAFPNTISLPLIAIAVSVLPHPCSINRAYPDPPLLKCSNAWLYPAI